MNPDEIKAIVEVLVQQYGATMVVFLVFSVVIPMIGIKIFDRFLAWRKLKKSNGGGSSNGKSTITADDLEKMQKAIIKKVIESEGKVNLRIDKTHDWLKRVEDQIDSIREKVGEVRGMLSRRP